MSQDETDTRQSVILGPLIDDQRRFEYDPFFDRSTAKPYIYEEGDGTERAESPSITRQLGRRLSVLSIRSARRRSRVMSGGEGEDGGNGSRSGVSSVVGSPQSEEFSFQSADWPSATASQPTGSASFQTHEGSATPTSLNSAMSTPVTHSGVPTFANSPIETRRMTLPSVPEDADAPSSSASSPVKRRNRFSLGSIRSVPSPRSPHSPTSTRRGDPWGSGVPGEREILSGPEGKAEDPGWVKDPTGKELLDLLEAENERRNRANGLLGKLRLGDDETVPTNVGDRTVKSLYVNPELSSWGGKKSVVSSTQPKEKKPPHVMKQGLPKSPDATLFGEGFGRGTEAYGRRPEKDGDESVDGRTQDRIIGQKVQNDRTEALESEGNEAEQSVDAGDEEDAGEESADESSQDNTPQTDYETIASRRKRGKAGKARELSINTDLGATYDILPQTVE